MASANGILCGVCETQFVVREAAFWCAECDEGLCSTCEKHNRASKGTKNHEITSVNDFQQIPSSIASINQYCSDHVHYCFRREKRRCPHCIITNHKTWDLIAIDEIVQTSNTSALFDIMEQSIQDMKRNMTKIVEDRRQNLEKIQQQRQKFHTDIREIQEKINKHLNQLENEIQQDIQAAKQKVQSQTEKLLSKLSDHDKSLELQKNIFATKSFATDLQTVLVGKMFEAEVQNEEKLLQSLIEDGSLQQINLQFRIDDKMSEILSLTRIGEISVITKKPTITLTMDRDDQAQHLLPKISKSINDINLSLLKHLKYQMRKYNLYS
ncbi:unnamed protein product [Mytilus edulis]|uniref:B box-type domain-containing protein n=1 Tax=Mytilus edulis TaxID=6550 RepID=A0A8S3R212_MYTED|nr:unnamed protein product [Mytilus edulis]